MRKRNPGLKPHTGTHSQDGSDEIKVEDLGTDEVDTNKIAKPDGDGGIEWVPAAAGGAHASSHESGGGDEVDVTDLSGVLADAQNADKIQDKDVSASEPTKNDVLMWNGTEYVPTAEGSTFTFSIATFTDSGGATTLEIGSGVWKAIGAISFEATYSNGPAIATPSVNISGFGAAWGGALEMTTAPDYTGPTVNTEAIAYPSSPGSATLTLSATDGADPDTDNNAHNFWNNRYWGVSTNEDLTGAQVKALANSELSNSKSKTFTVNATAGTYIWWCYPARLGAATLTVGGFPLSLDGDNDPSVVSVTNDSGYVENYNCYRSEFSGLGSTTVVSG